MIRQNPFLEAYERAFWQRKESQLPNWKIFIPAVIVAMIVATMIFLATAKAETISPKPATVTKCDVINLALIARIESNGNPKAISPRGALGKYQVMPCVLQEFNKLNRFLTSCDSQGHSLNAYRKLRFSRADMFNPTLCSQVAGWYINDRIPEMLMYYHKPVTTENILWAYNAGIGNLVRGIKPLETRKYIAKYKRLEQSTNS